MSNALQRLDFVVSLLDKVSGPASKIMKTMDRVTTNIQSGYRKIGYGAAGLFSVGYAFDSIVQPAKEMQSALGTVKSLDVEASVLDNLRKTSMQTAAQYGLDATDIVNASYDIQSSINGLVGSELGNFSRVSAILAKGTKANIGTITSYTGTMYGIFKNQADAMGKSKWIEMLAGQTATAVQMFKTTGAEMSSAFTSVGASATKLGVPINEQIAILGTLQSTMSGSEAGTKYTAFLDGVGKAQKTLGLRFTDSKGQILPIIDIMDKIQNKFGDLKVLSDSDLLKTAFGSKEAVDLIKQLSSDVTGLDKNIGLIGQQKGMDQAIKMAKDITDPWDQSTAAVKNFRIEFGRRLLSIFTPVYNGITLVASKMTRWMDMFPHLTNWVIKGTLAVGGIIGAISALSIIVGVSKFVIVGWTATTTLAKLALMPFGPLLTATKAGWLAMNLSVALGNGIMATAKFGLLGMLGSMKMMVLQSKIAAGTMWIFNGGLWGMTAALLANPITWVVLGIITLTAAVVAAVVYWDTWTGKLKEWGGEFLNFIGAFDFVDGVLAAWNKLPEWWASFKSWIGSLNIFSFIGDSIDWLIDKINMIPGINIDTKTETPKPVSAPASLNSNSAPRMARGGLVNQISNATSNNHSRTIGDININNYGQAMNGQTLMNELAFAAP